MREIKIDYILQNEETGRFTHLIFTLGNLEKTNLLKYMTEEFSRWAIIARRLSTGLKDKSGTEIFEGDVVEWKQLNAWHKNMVYWLGSGFYADASEWVDYLNEPIGLSLISKLDARVIGNIYENPELLVKEETQ